MKEGTGGLVKCPWRWSWWWGILQRPEWWWSEFWKAAFHFDCRRRIPDFRNWRQVHRHLLMAVREEASCLAVHLKGKKCFYKDLEVEEIEDTWLGSALLCTLVLLCTQTLKVPWSLRDIESVWTVFNESLSYPSVCSVLRPCCYPQSRSWASCRRKFQSFRC